MDGEESISFVRKVDNEKYVLREMKMLSKSDRNIVIVLAPNNNNPSVFVLLMSGNWTTSVEIVRNGIVDHWLIIRFSY